MGQSMLGWKADEFFSTFKQHLDALGPHGMDELRIIFAKAAANVSDVFQRLNNEHLDQILENLRVLTRNLQQLDVNIFHEAFKSFQHTNNIASDKLTKLDINHLQETLKPFQQIANSIALTTQNIPKTLDAFKYTLLFTGLMVGLVTWTLICFMENLDKRTDRLSANMQALSTEITVQGNLHHQREFAEAVYSLVQQKRAEQILYPDNYPTTNYTFQSRYTIFHPASDWHGNLFALASKGWCDEYLEADHEECILDRLRLFNNPEKFTTYLREYGTSEVIKNTDHTLSVTHILLPSAHPYTLQFTLRVPEKLHPVRVVGQTDRNGKPYCRACIIAVDLSDIVDIELLPEHEAADYVPSKSATDKRLYPILWLIIAALWLKMVLGAVVDFVGDVAWNVSNAYFGLAEFLSFGVTKFLSFGA